jgi:hypothetical protein
VKCTLALALLLVAAAAAPAAAGVSVAIDIETLNELLPALTAEEIQVPIAGARTLGVKLQDLRVTRLDPLSRRVLGTLTVRVPSMGLAVPVEPKMSLRAIPGDESFVELRFEELLLDIPLVRAMNLAGAVPKLTFPANTEFLVQGSRGNVEVRSRLADVTLSAAAIHLEFDVDARPRSGPE